VLAAGQTLVLLTAGIDLSVASTATMGSYVTAVFSGSGTTTAILIGLGVGAAIGLVNGIGIGVFSVNPLIMTLGISIITVGLLSVGNETFLSKAPAIPDLISTVGSGRVFHYVPNNVFVWIAIAVIIIGGLRATGLGRLIYAIGDNEVACRLAGARAWQVRIVVYTLCGILSAIAGMLYLGYTASPSLDLVDPYLLPSIAAAVVGGTSIFGGSGGYGSTILGALILTVLNTLLTLLDATESIKQMIYGAIIVLLGAFYIQTLRNR
jgi:ribose transport system permease protein